jgi:mannitol-1-/sugar-/sorbitol-6-phosphatase
MRHLRARAILFDMDGTLIDSAEASENTWRNWAAKNQVPIERILDLHHGRRPEETIAMVAPHLSAIEEAKVIYNEQESLIQGIYPIAGANTFFESVPRDQCALVTAATRKIVDLRFKVVGLMPPDVCVTSEMVTAGKPSPEGYLQAAQRLEYEPRDCIVFEDSPAGLIAAHRAGMRSVAIVSSFTEESLRKQLEPMIAPVGFLQGYYGVVFSDGFLRLPD